MAAAPKQAGSLISAQHENPAPHPQQSLPAAQIAIQSVAEADSQHVTVVQGVARI